MRGGPKMAHNQKQKQLQSKDSMLFTYAPTLIGQNGLPGLIDEALQTDSTLKKLAIH